MIKTLDDLLNSPEYDRNRWGSNSDDYLNDSDRAERCDDAARYGCDGSTHGEYIQDWRDMLDWIDLPDSVKQSIHAEIDACEAWHVENGSIDEEIG
jgi:hypothetical protein